LVFWIESFSTHKCKLEKQRIVVWHGVFVIFLLGLAGNGCHLLPELLAVKHGRRLAWNREGTDRFYAT